MLILQPTFSDLSREQIEAYLLEVRARRMRAVVEYHAGVNAKTTHLMGKLQAKIAKEYALLAKDLNKMEELQEKAEARLATLQELANEYGAANDQLVEIEDGDTERSEQPTRSRAARST